MWTEGRLARVLETALAAVLLVAFFLPWLSAGEVALSAYGLADLSAQVGPLGEALGVLPRQIPTVPETLLRLYLLLPAAAVLVIVLGLLGRRAPWAAWLLVIAATAVTAHVLLMLGPIAVRAAGSGLILSALGAVALLIVRISADNNAFIGFVDRLSLWIGHSFGWCIVVLTLGGSYEVFVRYVLRAPTTWAYDVGYMMYGPLFLMAGAYTLSRGGHVRGDFLYRMWRPRTQAAVDFVLYILFLLPGSAAMVYAGFGFARQSWRFNETSIYSPAGVPIYPMKTLIPIAATLLIIQGLAELCRCWQCMQTGRWPRRLHDVEEMDVVREYAEGHAQAGEPGHAAAPPPGEPR
ncbi:MAG TPA: TRAP transporter small permease subunit [Geminicoccaceae bacterium]|nr:TRAP transporter small permease subunit [Geminicoccaceae bacterium]